jgi:hypothetical protein
MKIRTLCLVFAATVLAGGCAVYPAYDSYDEVVVYSAPPPAPYEYPGFPPAASSVWIGGYWNWGGSSYHWVPGRWETPRPGYQWAPRRWEREGNHWRQEGGRWERDAGPRHEPGPAPQPRTYHRPGDPSPEPRISGRPDHERTPPPRTERDGRRPSTDRPVPSVEPRGEPRDVRTGIPQRNWMSPPAEERPAQESSGGPITFPWRGESRR